MLLLLVVLPGLFVQADNTPDLQSGENGNSQTVAVLDASMVPTYTAQGAHIQVVENTLLAARIPNPDIGYDLGHGDSVTNQVVEIYIVQSGDTLTGIANKFDISIDTIRWQNKLDSSRIRIGQKLEILPVTGVNHQVAQKDTLESIAKQYKVSAASIASFNGLEVDGPLVLDQKLIIPGASIPQPKITKPRPANTVRPATNTVRNGVNINRYPTRMISYPHYPGYFIRPVSGYRLSRGIHGMNAVDIAAPRGVPVVASAGGTASTVRYSGWNSGYGKYVIISHPNGTQTLYAHMSGVQVGPGQRVSQGQTIGYVGSTGNSTGNHLHFEVRGARNPITY